MVLLAQYYDGRPPGGMFISEKYDGIRALWNGRDFLTRNGRIIDVPARFKVGIPKFEVDGELWCGRGNFGLAQGMTKGGANHRGWDSAYFMAFDLPTHWGSFARRAKKLARLKPTATMCIVAHAKVRDINSVRWLYESILEDGGEGVMLRDPTAKYVRDRTCDLLKLKPSNDWSIYDQAA